MRFLDNVLQDFIDRAPGRDGRRPPTPPVRERSVGLGLMGFHSFLQGQNVPFESALAKSWNMRIFKHLRRGCDAASKVLAEERGPCPDAAERGRDGALLPQDRHRPDGLDLDHLRRHQRRHRADPGQHLHPQDPVGLVRGEEPLPGARCWRPKAPTRRRSGPRSWRTRARCSTSTASADDEKDVYKTAFEIDQRWVDRAGRRPHRRRSASRSRSTSSCPATSTNGTCTCCTGRPGSGA